MGTAAEILSVALLSTVCGSHLNLEMLGFWRQKTQSTQRKTLGNKDRKQQETQPTYDTESGI